MLKVFPIVKAEQRNTDAPYWTVMVDRENFISRSSLPGAQKGILVKQPLSLSLTRVYFFLRQTALWEGQSFRWHSRLQYQTSLHLPHVISFFMLLMSVQVLQR